MKNNISGLRLFVSIMLLALFSCKTLIATYDQYSYTQISAEKVDMLAIIGKATDDYSSHATEMESILNRFQKAKEYDIHKPKNEVMTQLWGILEKMLTDTSRLPVSDAPKGLLARWEKNKKLSAVFIGEAKEQVSEAFDYLLELESSKIKKDNVALNQFITTNK